MTENRSDERGSEQSASTEQLLGALRLTSQALQQFLIAQARAGGLGLLELLTLIRAADGDGVTTLAASRALGVSSSTMTGLSDRLDADGLIRRLPYPADRRLILLRANAKGRRLLERRLGPLLAALGELAESLDPAARVSLTSFHGQAAELLIAHALAAPPPRGPAVPGSAPRRPRTRPRSGVYKRDT